MESKIHIIGVGSDGLKGLTGKPRELVASRRTGPRLRTDFQPRARIDCPALPHRRQSARSGADARDASRQETHGRRRLAAIRFSTASPAICARSSARNASRFGPTSAPCSLLSPASRRSWEEAYLTNLATHSLESVLDRIRTAETVGIFTSEDEGPPIDRQQLLARGLDYFRAYVCENLGCPDERVTQGELSEIRDMEFAPLNVMILKRKPAGPISSGRRRSFAASAIRTTCSSKAGPRAA